MINIDTEYENETDFNKCKQNSMTIVKANDDTISFELVETLSGKPVKNRIGWYEKFHVWKDKRVIGIFEAFKDKDSNYMNFFSGPSN